MQIYYYRDCHAINQQNSLYPHNRLNTNPLNPQNTTHITFKTLPTYNPQNTSHTSIKTLHTNPSQYYPHIRQNSTHPTLKTLPTQPSKHYIHNPQKHYQHNPQNTAYTTLKTLPTQPSTFHPLPIHICPNYLRQRDKYQILSGLTVRHGHVVASDQL